jgi:hypothetical protein
MLDAILKVIEENDFSPLQRQRMRKRLTKAARQGRLHFNPNMNPDTAVDWAYRICAANLMKGRYDWWGWEARSGWSWKLANEEWFYPRWDGLPCKLLVLGEQGLGDEILFLSCAQDLLDQNPDVTWEVDHRLIPIAERSFPGVRFVSRWKDDATRTPYELSDPRGEFDAYIPAGGLCKLYRHSRLDFPKTAWLLPDPSRVEHWRERVEGRVGISWAGGIGNEHFLPPEDLAAGIVNPVNLQYNASWLGAEDIECRDFDDHIALVAALDRVVSVPTALVHLCGAIGQQVEVIRPPKNVAAGGGTQLRWMFGGWNGTSDWYGPWFRTWPSLATYQQERR